MCEHSRSGQECIAESFNGIAELVRIDIRQGVLEPSIDSILACSGRRDRHPLDRAASTHPHRARGPRPAPRGGLRGCQRLSPHRPGPALAVHGVRDKRCRVRRPRRAQYVVHAPGIAGQNAKQRQLLTAKLADTEQRIRTATRRDRARHRPHAHRRAHPYAEGRARADRGGARHARHRPARARDARHRGGARRPRLPTQPRTATRERPTQNCAAGSTKPSNSPSSSTATRPKYD